jgi:hypothetical protein
VAGDQLRNRLVGNEDGDPTICFFDSCRVLIRTLPALQHDVDKPEDVDSGSEDHAPDECRYAVMSRPFVRVETEVKKRRPLLAVGPQNEVTMNQLFTDAELNTPRRRYYLVDGFDVYYPRSPVHCLGIQALRQQTATAAMTL